MKLGEMIRELRENSGMTQEHLASKLNTTKQTIYKYEQGIVTNIPSDKLEAIALIFDVSPASLMGWDDDVQKMIFTNNLNHYIAQSKLTQKKIAESIGVSPQTLNTWCQGIAIPRMKKIQALADFFKINKSDLIEDRNSFSVPADGYTKEELELISVYRSLNDDGRAFVDHIKELLKTSPKYYDGYHKQEE